MQHFGNAAIIAAAIIEAVEATAENNMSTFAVFCIVIGFVIGRIK